MSEMSDFLEDLVVEHLFRTATFAKPTVIAIALLTTNAVDADDGQFTTGTGVEVPNSNAYARASDGDAQSNTMDPLDANWSATGGGDGQTDNVAAITFPQASGSWGTVAAMAFVNSATFDAGDMLFYSAVDTSRAIDNGDTAEFAIGAITITFD